MKAITYLKEIHYVSVLTSSMTYKPYKSRTYPLSEFFYDPLWYWNPRAKVSSMSLKVHKAPLYIVL